MSFRPNNDILADFVVNEVPAGVRTTLTEEQIRAVRSAAKKRHAVDVRLAIPLVFTQIYFVVLVGKDTRSETVEQFRERRSKAGFQLTSAAAALIAAGAVVVGAVALYIVKSRAGINIFPGHVRDFLPFLN